MKWRKPRRGRGPHELGGYKTARRGGCGDRVGGAAACGVRWASRVMGCGVGEFGLALGRPVARSIVWPLSVLLVFRVFVCVLVSATPAEVTVTKAT